jgi:predicted permease
VLGRLAPGATPERAGAELTAFFRRDGAPPPVRKLTGVVHTLPERVLGTTRPAVLVFAGAAALLLVITCVNVATLCLVRAGAREREVGVRAAIGAGRGRLIAQFLAEHALIAAAGGALGVGVAAAAVGAFVRLAPAGPTGLPRVDEIHLNMAALVGAVAISGVALVLFGLAPAFRGVAGATSSRLATTLRSGTRQSASRGSRLAMEGLVAGQIALALVVLSAAALLVQSLRRLERADLAFAGSRLVVAELALRTDRYPTAERQAAVITQLAREIGALPGVQAVSPVVAAPFSGSGGWDGRPRVEGTVAAGRGGKPDAQHGGRRPRLLRRARLAPVHGRLLTADDRQGAPPVVVLSASAARALGTIVGATAGAAAGGGDAALIGRRLLLAGDQAATVVGVVPDTRYRDLREARASIYFPLGQSPFPFAPTTLVIGTSGARGGAPDALVPALGRVVADAAPGVTLAHAAPFAAYMDAPLAQPRLNALLLVAFAGAAVVLAAVGVFGVMATMVRQRTRELGMRVALGATARDVVRLVLTRGLAVGAAGAAAGVLGALALNRFLGALLYDVSPTDAATLGAAAALLVVLGGLAALGPAWTGARVDPATTLRAE